MAFKWSYKLLILRRWVLTLLEAAPTDVKCQTVEWRVILCIWISFENVYLLMEHKFLIIVVILVYVMICNLWIYWYLILACCTRLIWWLTGIKLAPLIQLQSVNAAMNRHSHELFCLSPMKCPVGIRPIRVNLGGPLRLTNGFFLNF